MGIDAGFDMVPQLYENDDLVVVKPNSIEFNAGEHPLLPFEGHKVLRFSAKISGSHAEGVEEYIDTITRVAKVYFGSRARYGNEAGDDWGFRNWPEVIDSFNSYEKPDEPEVPTSVTQYLSKNDPISELNLELFGIQLVPDKGRGLVACLNIAKGTRILYEKPFFTTLNVSPMSLMESDVGTKLKALSKTEQRQFLSLHNHFPGKYPFSGIVKTNALPCGPDPMIGGVDPTTCLIIYSCLPNAHNSWNSDTKCETIHAIQDIRSEEEITISYDKGGSANSRRTHLKDKLGFDSNCSPCSLPLPDLLEEWYKGGAGALIARLYYDAFQITITHGDQARARIFTERGYRSRVSMEGDDSPETRKMKNLMENPAGHKNFGASKRWKTANGLVPKGLDTDAFEKWL